MLVPLSEGSARAEQWEPSSVTSAVRRWREQPYPPLLCHEPGMSGGPKGSEKCGPQAAVVFIIGLAAGTGCTIASKALFQLEARGMTGEVETFDPPLFQTWVMFLGMMFALPAHFVSEWHKGYKLQANPAALAELRAEQAKVRNGLRTSRQRLAPRYPASCLQPANPLSTQPCPPDPNPPRPFPRHPPPRPTPHVPVQHPNLASSQVTSKTYMLLAIPSFFDLLATVTLQSEPSPPKHGPHLSPSPDTHHHPHPHPHLHPPPSPRPAT